MSPYNKEQCYIVISFRDSACVCVSVLNIKSQAEIDDRKLSVFAEAYGNDLS